MVAGKETLLVAAVLVFTLVPHSEGIIWGSEAPPHSRPYMASIQAQAGDTMKHECGGFVIADQWVMTAVHCFPSGPDQKKVVLGVHSLSESEETKQTFDILQLYNHPDFNPLNHDNDIALIKLDRPYNASVAVSAVEYVRAGGTNPEKDAEVETAGWGSIDNLSLRPDKLQEATLTIINPRLCKRSDYYSYKFTDNMMCANRLFQATGRGRQKTVDSCDGDSGGPLLYNGVVVGITSTGGSKCGQVKKPGVYTIISHYTEWINSTMTSSDTTKATE